MTDAEKQLAVIQSPTSVTEFTQGYNALINFVKKALKPNIDYGIIPGTKKKTLLQPGSEKIAKFYGLMPNTETIDKVEDWERGFFFYRAKCTLTHFNSGKFAGAATRSCNSKEKSFATSYGKKRTADELAEVVNNIEARAHKRAITAAVKFATNATDIFDEDVEEEIATDTTTGKFKAEENQVRSDMLKKLFAAAGERCFKEEGLKQGLYKKYNVESTTNLTTYQLMEAYEQLILTWRISGNNGKPCKITADISVKTENSVNPSASGEAKAIEEHIDIPINTKPIPEGWQKAESGEIEEVIPTKVDNVGIKQETLIADADVPVSEVDKASADFSKENKVAEGMDEIRMCRKCNKMLDPQDGEQRKAAKLPVWFCNKGCETDYWGSIPAKKDPSKNGWTFNKK